MKFLRRLVLIATAGFAWYWSLQLFFVWSGAQQILADPTHQSSKFLKSFVEYQPLPRMVEDSSIVWKGLIIIGALLALAFLIVNPGLKGGWVKRGLLFGLLHWMIMVPWFEFYLPYNVMREPLMLVSFEAILWLGLALTVGLYMSLVTNFKR